MSGIAFTEIDDIDVLIEKSVEFNELNEKDYLELFNKKISDGVISDKSGFYDNNWIIKVAGIERKIIFFNDIELKKLSDLFDKNIKEFELAYKSFIIFKINTPTSIFKFNIFMKKLVMDFEKSKVDNIIARMVKDFLSYIKISSDKFELFEKIVDKIEQREDNTRTLPEFEDILKITDIINDITENKNIYDYKDYILTIMWWKICSILPLRPSEFLRTKYDCVYEKDNKFYLVVRRSKAKSKMKKNIKNISDVDDYYYEDTVNIDEELFYFINKYKKLLITEFSYADNLELFPYEIILKFTSRKRRKMNKDIITDGDLRNNINIFYEKVVKEEYGLEPISKFIKKNEEIKYIEKLIPYDARHVAIINLILLGTDILEVMYLAGHTSVNMAYSYFAHVKEFSKGYALGYAKKLKENNKNIEVNKNDRENNKIKGNEEFKRILGTIQGKKYEPQKVKGGFCHYQNIDSDKSICFRYERNHKICEYFVADKMEIIKEEIEKIEEKLDTDIKILIDLIEDMKGISKFNELYQTTSYRISKDIQELSILNSKLIMEE